MMPLTGLLCLLSPFNRLSARRCVGVRVPRPRDGTFTYSSPGGMEEKVVPGMRVLVAIQQVHQESPRKAAVTAVSLHPKEVSLPVSCAGQSYRIILYY